MDTTTIEPTFDVDKLFEEMELKQYSSDFKSSLDVVILKVNNQEFKLTNKKSYELDILGHSMLDWVKEAVKDYDVTEVECGIDSSIFDVVRPLLKNSKYTLILYSDTPLITPNTISDIMSYVSAKELKVCKLNRGYVFDTEYLRTCEKVYSLNTYAFNAEDFMAAVNFTELNKITLVMQNRINQFHMQNGVQILKPETNTIEADVVIGKNVVIYPFNELRGETVIGDNVILKSSNLIEDSIIFENCEIEHSTISKSVIKSNCKIKSYCNIYNNSLVNENNTLHSMVLDHKEIK